MAIELKAVKPLITVIGALVVCQNGAIGGELRPVPGSYRPTQEAPASAQGQFVQPGPSPAYSQSGISPSPAAPSYLPSTQPAVPYYAPPAYTAPTYAPTYGGGYRDLGFGMFPFDSFTPFGFGDRRNDSVYGYLPPAPGGYVAPIYHPPLPAAPPLYGAYTYGTQPAGGYGTPAPSYPQTPGYPEAQQPAPQASAAPQPSAKPQITQPAPASKPPRPFSNPQESGSAFVQRSVNLGRSDSRFRPPELKGTP